MTPKEFIAWLQGYMTEKEEISTKVVKDQLKEVVTCISDKDSEDEIKNFMDRIWKDMESLKKQTGYVDINLPYTNCPALTPPFKITSATVNGSTFFNPEESD